MGGVVEAVVWIAVNGVRRRWLACSPHDPVALAVGHAVTEQWVPSASDIDSAAVIAGPGGATGVDLIVSAAAYEDHLALQRHRVSNGCGLRHEIDCTPGALRERRRAATAAAPTAEQLSELFRALFALTDALASEGGVHAAALTDGTALVHSATDVARHCAVDRVIGAALARDAQLYGLGLVLSARISGAMALKAARTGIGWVASRSIATSLALEIAADAGMPVVQRAVRRSRTQ